jgi:hypothetical protein
VLLFTGDYPCDCGRFSYHSVLSLSEVIWIRAVRNISSRLELSSWVSGVLFLTCRCSDIRGYDASWFYPTTASQEQDYSDFPRTWTWEKTRGIQNGKEQCINYYNVNPISQSRNESSLKCPAESTILCTRNQLHDI